MELQQLTATGTVLPCAAGCRGQMQGLMLLLSVRLLPDVKAATAAEMDVSVAEKSCVLAQLTCQGS